MNLSPINQTRFTSNNVKLIIDQIPSEALQKYGNGFRAAIHALENNGKNDNVIIRGSEEGLLLDISNPMGLFETLKVTDSRKAEITINDTTKAMLETTNTERFGKNKVPEYIQRMIQNTYKALNEIAEEARINIEKSILDTYNEFYKNFEQFTL